MRKQMGSLALQSTQGQAEVLFPKKSSGLAVLALVTILVVVALAFVLLFLPPGGPVSIEVSSAVPTGHYAPNCEAVAAIGSSPGCALAQWYAGSQGQEFTIACMGK